MSAPAVLVVSYRRADLLARCLDSVEQHLPDSPIFVWDNASEGSDEIIAMASSYPDIQWTFHPRNIGYAAAMNALAEQAEDRDLLLLNPDAELVGPLARSLAALAEPDVAAVSPTLADDAHPWDIARREQTVLRTLVSTAGYADRLRGQFFSDRYASAPSEVDGYLSGCALLVSRRAWQRIGPFDERFYLYGEEAEWQRRAREHRQRLVLIDEPHVRHNGHGTVADDATAANRSTDLLRANQQVLLGRNGNGGRGALYRAGTTILGAVQRSHRRARRNWAADVARRSDPTAPHVVLTTNELCRGGAERQRVVLANELSARGFPVTIVCLQALGPLVSEVDNRVRIELTPWWQPSIDSLPRDTVLITGITNTEAGFAWGLRARNTLHRRRTRWLAAAHETTDGGPAYNRALTSAVRASDGIVVLSPSHADALNSFGPLHQRFFVAPNGITPHLAQPFTVGSPLRLGMLCRIVELKNPHLLIAALDSLREYDWTLDICGDGPDRARLEAMTPAELRGRIRWHGAVSGPGEAFEHFDVLCVPSRTEALPLVILEAMSAGLPVIASPVGSIPDVLADGAGILTTAATKSAWQQTLRTVFADPSALETVAKTGADRAAEHYTVSAMTDAYIGAIQAAL